MNVEYLGQFKLDYKVDADYEQGWILKKLCVEDDSDYYESELFMRHSEIIEGIGEIHGIGGETNNSNIVLQFDEDDCEVVKLWRIW